MSVVSCSPVSQGRTGSLDFSQGRTYVRRFRVITDSDLDGPLTVTLHAGIPTIGTPYVTDTESDSVAFLRSVEPQQSPDDPRVWYVDCRYSSRADGGGPSSVPGSDQGGGGGGEPGKGGASPEGRPENPLNRPVVWSFTFVEMKKAVEEDLDGLKITNSTGRFFEPPYEIDTQLGQITAVKNYAEFTYDEASGYLNAINADAWHGLPAKTVKIKGLDIKSNYENGVSFVTATWTFLHNPDEWNPTRILDKGPYYLVANKEVSFTDKHGRILPEGYLDGAGGKLTPPLVHVWNLFRFHEEISFADIP